MPAAKRKRSRRRAVKPEPTRRRKPLSVQKKALLAGAGVAAASAAGYVAYRKLKRK